MPPAVMTQPVSESPVKVANTGKDWAATFPENFDKKVESDLFMTRCLYVAFSHIMESRRLIPSEVFKKRTIEGIVKTYVMNLKHPLGLRIANKFRGAGEAIKLGYLDSFVLIISESEENPDDAIEVFTWKMHYEDDGSCSASLSGSQGETFANIVFSGLESVKQQTRSLLLRVRHICRNLLAPLPSGICPSFRVTYTSKTPKGYQAEGFKRFPKKEIYNLDDRAKEVAIGGVATPQTKVLLSIKSVYIDDEYIMAMRMNETDINHADVSMFNHTIMEGNLSFNDSIEQARLDNHNTSSESMSSARIKRASRRQAKHDDSGDSVPAKKSPDAKKEEVTRVGRRPVRGKNTKYEIPEKTCPSPGASSNMTKLSPESSPNKSG